MITDDDSIDAIPSIEDDEAWHALALALPPRSPSATLRQRLLDAAAGPDERYAPFSERLARLFDVSLERARELLTAITDPGFWQDVIAPGVALVHLEGGPRVATADVGLVRVDAGARFPTHHHLGEENTLLLQGESIDDEGRRNRAGDSIRLTTGTTHAFVAGPDEDLIYAVVVDGVDIPGIGRTRP